MSNIDNLKRHEIISATSTRGWFYIKEIAEKTVSDMERKAIDEDDDAKGATLRRRANAARHFLTSFLDTIESMSRFDSPETPVEETGKPDDDIYIPAY